MHNELKNCERNISSNQAFEIIGAQFDQLKLNIDYRAVGNEIQTYHCKLTVPDHNWVFFGCGKGLGIQSKVSASFEAYEHYLGYKELTNPENKLIEFKSFSEVFEAQKNINQKYLPHKLLDQKYSNDIIPWLQYVDFKTSGTFYYPLFLAEPRYATEIAKFANDNFDYDNLTGFASDSGTASGTSFIEAAIHGLNECIERDATSIFLARCFVKKQPLELIDKNSLPADIQSYIRDIEIEFADDLAIIDMTSDLGVPTFCVAFTKQHTPIQPKGFGTSLFKKYALERALLESLQPLHLRNENLDQMELGIINFLQPYPLLLQAAVANIGEAIQENNYQMKSFAEMTEPTLKNLTLEAQFEELLNRFHSRGFFPKFLEISEVNAPICCLKIFVPGFEQFYLISHGKFILPGERAIGNSGDSPSLRHYSSGTNPLRGIIRN